MKRDWTIRLIAMIAILLVIAWALIERNDNLREKNEQLQKRISYLEDRQVEIDRAILESMKSIYDALPQPVNYVEVSYE